MQTSARFVKSKSIFERQYIAYVHNLSRIEQSLMGVQFAFVDYLYLSIIFEIKLLKSQKLWCYGDRWDDLNLTQADTTSLENSILF